MTQDSKDSLLKHLTGLVENEEETTTPFYKDFEYSTRDDYNYTGGTKILKCKDGNGNYNGKVLVFQPGYYSGNTSSNKIMLVDENSNILCNYNSWNTGTPFNSFIGLNIDEIGQVYGIDYDPYSEKYRFILMNNLSEPVKMPNGTYEYRAVLRNSWFIQNYTSDDDLTPSRPAILEKSRSNAIYYFALWDSIGQTLMPSTLEIKVGEGNTWVRLQDVTILDNYLLDNYIVFNSNNTPIATYYSLQSVYSDTTEIDQKVTKAVINGEGNPNYETFIESTKDFFNETFIYHDTKLIVKNNNWWFMIVSGYYGDNPYTQRVRVWEKNNGDPVMLYEHDSDVSITSYRRNPFVTCQEQDGTIYMYYGFQKESTEFSNDKLYFIATDMNIYQKGIDFFVDTGREIYKDLEQSMYLNSKYYLKKSIFLNPQLIPTIEADIVTIMYGSGVDTTPYSNIEDISPTKGVLYDNNDKMIFARNLYNKKVYGNRTISIVNVPNSDLNNVNIKTGALLGYTNLDIDNNNINVEKNIYENLFVNYFDTLYMQDRNTTNYKDNLIGASRLNESVAKLNDYANAKATKVAIHYNDGTMAKGGISATITNNIATYSLTVYIPGDKNIDSIEILSEDENTIYQTIDTRGRFENNKYYTITQDVHIE